MSHQTFVPLLRDAVSVGAVVAVAGTAVGAGILFLPINAGLGGFWPLLILALLAFPMTFYAHRGLTRFVLSGREGADITEVVEEHFGIKAGALIPTA